MWLIGQVERTASSLSTQGSLSRRMVGSGWNVGYDDHTVVFIEDEKSLNKRSIVQQQVPT
jgi:hypothetical protein